MRDEASLGREQHEIWGRIATFWDAQLRSQPDVFPTAELVDIGAGTRVLDLGCGNGRFARYAASLGASVAAVDVSPIFIEIAKGYDTDGIDYRVIDSTDEQALLSLGARAFDVVVANMVLMNLVSLKPLARALSRLLEPGGMFVASLPHPCFPWVFTVDADDTARWRHGVLRMFALIGRVARRLPKGLTHRLATVVVPVLRGIRRRGYLTSVPRMMSAPGQPTPHYNFHRPLQELFRPFFAAGFTLDALTEPAEGMTVACPVDREIPNVLVFRLRLASTRTNSSSVTEPL